MSGRISLRDVAVATGMSVSTVSLALAGDRRVSTQTRQRIVEAASKLGYVRDPILASIAAGKFRHTGKPVCVATLGLNQAWTRRLRSQAETMGMSVRGFEGDPTRLPESVGALVLCGRHLDLEVIAKQARPTVLWEDEGPARPPVDLIETCEWWTATQGCIDRVRAAGWQRPAAILVPASPRHWHDDIRLGCVRQHGLPVLEWSDEAHQPGAIGAFLAEQRPDALVLGLPHVAEAVQQAGFHLPTAVLLVHDEPYFKRFAGWVPDQEHRGQVTLEVIEQRLRYGPRLPRRIVVPPRWQTGETLPARV